VETNEVVQPARTSICAIEHTNDEKLDFVEFKLRPAHAQYGKLHI